MDLLTRLKKMKIGFNKEMLNVPEIRFLEDENISLTINRGFTELYNERPQNPVLFLGKWLEKESRAQELVEKYKQNQKQKEQLIQRSLLQKKEMEKKELIEKQKKQKEEIHMNELKTFIKNCNNFWDNFNYICEELKKNVNSTGVYIVIYDLKRKSVTEDDDEFGHIHPSNSKVLRYIGWCKDHSFLHGKNLENNTGVTYDLILPKTVLVDPNQNQDNQENKTEQPQDVSKQQKDIPVDNITLNHLLIEDVILDPRMFFFREPRLGCYLALDITYQTSMKHESLLSAIQATKEYLENKEKQELRYKEWFDQKEQLEKEIEEIKKVIRKAEEEEEERKLREEQDKEINSKDEIKQIPVKASGVLSSPKQTVLQSPGITDPNVNSNLTEIQNIQNMITEWKEEPVQLKDYIKEEKKLIIALDTLGQDRLFTEAEEKYINDISILIKDSIQSLEKRLLEKDRDIRIAFDKKELANRALDIFNDEKSELILNAAANEYFNSEEFKSRNITDETIKAVEGDLARAKYLSTFILQGGVYDNLLGFELYEFVEYEKIFQNLFFFVRTEPTDINEPETNKLKWQLAKLHWRGFFLKLKEFVPRGAKPEQIKQIYKLNRIKINLENEIKKIEEVKDYSFSLYQLVDYVLFLIKIRYDDIVQRSATVLEKKEEREKIIQSNNEILNEREKIKEQATNLPLGENGEPVEFNLEEELEKYDKEHSLAEVPPDIDYDLDLDYDIK